MAMSMVRSGFQSVLRRSGRNVQSKRNFSSSAHHDDAYEAAKWEKISYAGIVGCTAFAAYNLSKGHPHYDEPPAYPYLHIRNKEFPWGTFHLITDLLNVFIYCYIGCSLGWFVSSLLRSVYLGLAHLIFTNLQSLGTVCASCNLRHIVLTLCALPYANICSCKPSWQKPLPGSCGFIDP